MTAMTVFPERHSDPILSGMSLRDAAAFLRGERAHEAGVLDWSVEKLRLWSLEELEFGIGEGPGHLDSAVRNVVRSSHAMKAPIGMVFSRIDHVARIGLMSPAEVGDPSGWTRGLLPAAIWSSKRNMTDHLSSLLTFPCQAVLTGHPGVSAMARLEPILERGGAGDFQISIFAQPQPEASLVEAQGQVLREIRYLHDEYLSRPGLEHENHPAASLCLELLEATQERIQESMREGGWMVRFLLACRTGENLRQLSSQIAGLYGGGSGRPELLRWQSASPTGGITFLSTRELASYLRLPRRDLPGIRITQGGPRTPKAPPGGLADGLSVSVDRALPDRPVCLGRVVGNDGQPGQWLHLSADSLVRHALVAGMTGSGKSTTIEQILLELWRGHRIPWLVLEPGTNAGYRRLLASEIGEDIDGFALGDPRFKQLPLNPLYAPPGTLMAEHNAGLFAVLAAAFELVPPMPEVLKLAIEETYRTHGWNPAGIVPDGAAPRFAKLIDTIESMVMRLGYSGEIASNIHAGLVLRLRALLCGGLGTSLSTEDATDLSALTSRPVIVELGALANSESQSFVLGLIALQLRHHWRRNGRSEHLRHLTVIEEAHRLLSRPAVARSESSQSRAVEDIGHLIAELRGMGAGVLIADQSPSGLHPAVIANTAIKILHRLDHPDDRDLAIRSVNLPAESEVIVGSLRPGEGLARIDQRGLPYRIQFPNPAKTYGALPLPEWPAIESTEPPWGATPAEHCPVCTAVNCSDRAESREPARLVTRLQRLRELSTQGARPVWAWASDEAASLQASDHPLAPLCFLVGLAEAAGLSPQTIREMRTTFSRFHE